MKFFPCPAIHFHLVLPLFLTVSHKTVVSAATPTWTGSLSSNWFVAGNWSPAIVPSLSDYAVVNQGTVTMTSGGVVGVLKLSLALSGTASLEIAGGTAFSSGNANIGDLAGGQGRLAVSGVGGNGNQTSWRNHADLRVGNVGTGLLEIRNGGNVSTETLSVGATGSILTVTGFSSNGARSTLTASSGRINGDLAILDGGLFNSYNLDVRGSTRVSGVNSNGMSSTLHAPSEISIFGNLTVSDGGAVTDRSGEIPSLGNATVTGVSTGGIRSSWTSHFFQTGRFGGAPKLSILDGGLFVSDSCNLSYNAAASSHTVATISGVSDEGLSSTMRVSGLSMGGVNGRADMAITDGGLVEVTVGYISLEQGSSIQVSGVHASGKRSTLISKDELNVWTGSLSVTGGAMVECPSVFMGFRGNSSNVTVTGTDGKGNASTLWCKKGGIGTGFDLNARIVVADGGHLIASSVSLENGAGWGGLHELQLNGGQHQGILETAFVSADQADALFAFDGGVFRSTDSGSSLRNFDPGEVQFLKGGAHFDTGGHSNSLNVALEGAGGLTKLGSGTLALTAANSYQGDTTVKEGLLLLNNKTGSATGSGNVQIFTGGSLGGSGSMAGSVFNSGTVTPGNSPGTLHIGGNFQQNASGTLAMEIDSPEAFDVLSVGGNVRLGGSLKITNVAPLEFGQQFDVIQAKGAIRGTFDSIFFSNPSEARERFITTGGTGTLIIAPETYSQAARGPNEMSLASALDTWIDDTAGDTKTVAENLDQLSAAEYHSAFAAISPSLYGAALATAIEQSQSQSTALSQHLNSRRLRQVPVTDADKNWEAWALSSGLYSTGSMSSLAGDDFSGGSFLSGIESTLNATFSAGLFTGYGDSQGDFAGSSEIEQDRLTFGTYATAHRDGYYANSALGFGILEMDVTRAIRFGGLSREAHSSTDGIEFFGLISGGYDFRRANWVFGPTASLQYSKVRYDDVKERGAGALDLAVENPEDDSLRSQIGGRVAYLHKANEQLTLIPEARVFWQHEFLRDSETLHASLEQGTGADFTHQVSDSDGDSVFGGVALGFQTSFGFYGNVSYDIEIGRESELNHTLSVGADWNF